MIEQYRPFGFCSPVSSTVVRTSDRTRRFTWCVRISSGARKPFCMSFWIRLHFSFFQNSRVTAPPFQAPTRLEVLAPLRSLERQIKLELSSTFSQREKGCFKVVWLQVKENINKDILWHSGEMVSCNGVITKTHFRFLSQLYYSGLDYKQWSISVIFNLKSRKMFSWRWESGHHRKRRVFGLKS